MAVKTIQRRPVTQHDVAAKAGCSQNTVALALRDSPRISEARRKQIRQIARRLGYHPNFAARSLRQKRSGLIGVYTSVLDDVRTDYVRELVGRLHSTEHKPMFGVDPDRPVPWFKSPWIETLRQFQVEAMILLAWHDRIEVPDWHDEIPLVFTGCQPDESLPCDVVGLDRRDAGRMATEHLISRGHKRIRMIENSPSRLLTEGYLQTMNAAGLEPSVHNIGPTHSPRNEVIDELITASDRPTAIVMIDSTRAMQACGRLMRAGLKIPDDIAVVSYDHLSWASDGVVALTTIEQPVADMVEKTIELTHNRIANPEWPRQHLTLKHNLVVRGSA